MREIKLRAFNKITKKMFQVNDIDGLMQNTHVCCKHGDACEEMRGIDGFLDEVELMQYVGRKDKDGKELYEGDVVRITQPDHIEGDTGEFTNRVRIASIKFDYYGVLAFLADGSRWSNGHDYDDYDEIIYHEWGNIKYEVIGNIYENPELLKEPPCSE